MYKLSKTKIKFYSSLSPDQFLCHSDLIWTKIVKSDKKGSKVRLEQEYAALLDLYAELNEFKVGTLIELMMDKYKDWSEDETDFYIVEKFMYESCNEYSNQPILSVITNDDEDPTHITSFKLVTTERFQWMVNHYPEKMIMVYNNPKLKLKSNPLYKNIQWPKNLKQEKELVEDLLSIGL